MTIVDEDGDVPYVEGSELTVLDAYKQYVQGQDPAQIAEDYRIKVARIHEALAYYYDNAEQMMRLESDSEGPESTDSVDVGTTRWEFVNLLCPICIEDYAQEDMDSPPPELAPVATSDPDIDDKAVWGYGPDYDGFDYDLWQMSNNVDPLVYCRECKMVFCADFSPVTPIDGGLEDPPREEAINRARELNQAFGPAEIRERIEELEDSIESYREEYGHGSPEDAERFGDLAEEGAREWMRVRYERAVTELALRISEAVTTLEMDRLETATADREGWSQSTPSDAGEALFGDGPEDESRLDDIADMPNSVKSRSRTERVIHDE